MLEYTKQARKANAEGIIKKLSLRNMEGFYAETKEDIIDLLKTLMKPGESVAWGGSMTLDETGVMEYLTSNDFKVLDRKAPKNNEETRAMKAAMINANHFFMSTNAITQDGILVNIDGYANRVSFLCYGPDQVIVIAGMNKVVPDVETGILRVRNIAAPPNTIRLHCDTPCAKLGHCADCLSEDCICSQVVITRRSSVKGRIKVILVGEDFGF